MEKLKLDLHIPYKINPKYIKNLNMKSKRIRRNAWNNKRKMATWTESEWFICEIILISVLVCTFETQSPRPIRGNYPVPHVFHDITGSCAGTGMPHCLFDAAAVHKYILLSWVAMVVTINLEKITHINN